MQLPPALRQICKKNVPLCAEPSVHLLKIDSVIESTIHCRASGQAPNKPRNEESQELALASMDTSACVCVPLEYKTSVRFFKHIPLRYCSCLQIVCTFYTYYIPQCLYYTHIVSLVGIVFRSRWSRPKNASWKLRSSSDSAVLDCPPSVARKPKYATRAPQFLAKLKFQKFPMFLNFMLLRYPDIGPALAPEAMKSNFLRRLKKK